MIESGIRGGIATISHRHAKANNEYMGTEFEPTKEYKLISYLDASNRYGWALSKQLSTSGFERMTDDELDDWKHLSCILEVDLDYPEDLHNLHNDYPLAPERVKIGNVEKQIPNLNNKTNYVVHYENLKLYESLGFKITKIHRKCIAGRIVLRTDEHTNVSLTTPSLPHFTPFDLIWFGLVL